MGRYVPIDRAREIVCTLCDDLENNTMCDSDMCDYMDLVLQESIEMGDYKKGFKDGRNEFLKVQEDRDKYFNENRELRASNKDLFAALENAKNAIKEMEEAYYELAHINSFYRLIFILQNDAICEAKKSGAKIDTSLIEELCRSEKKLMKEGADGREA